jgi:hypothetical protein
VLGHIAVQDAPPVMRNDQEAIEKSACARPLFASGNAGPQRRGRADRPSTTVVDRMRAEAIRAFDSGST